MTEDIFVRSAVEYIGKWVVQNGPPEPRVLHFHADVDWDENILYTLSYHELKILGLSPEIIVFFDEDGNIIGWRDDARKGSEWPGAVHRDTFLEAVVGELGLPEETRLGRYRTVQLPPLGWTHEGILFLKRRPQPQDILRAWINPQNLRVIQCLYDASPFR